MFLLVVLFSVILDTNKEREEEKNVLKIVSFWILCYLVRDVRKILETTPIFAREESLTKFRLLFESIIHLLLFVACAVKVSSMLWGRSQTMWTVLWTFLKIPKLSKISSTTRNSIPKRSFELWRSEKRPEVWPSPFYAKNLF